MVISVGVWILNINIKIYVITLMGWNKLKCYYKKKHLNKWCFYIKTSNTKSNHKKIVIEKTHPGVHEYEIHLHECKNHLQQWIDAMQNFHAWWFKWYLKEQTEFQSNVDHGAQSKSLNMMNNYIKPVRLMWGIRTKSSCKLGLKIYLPIAPIRKKKLPWTVSFWVVLRLRVFFGVTWASTVSTVVS